MGGILNKLKEKGPAGLPMGAWAGIVLVGVYLVYRWYVNRSVSSGVNAGAGPTTAAGGSGVTPTSIFVTVKNPKKPKAHRKRKPRHPRHKNRQARVQGLNATNRRALSGGSRSTPAFDRKTSTSAQKARLTTANIPHLNPPTAASPVGSPGFDKRNEGTAFHAPIITEEKLQAVQPPAKSSRKEKAAGRR